MTTSEKRGPGKGLILAVGIALSLAAAAPAFAQRGGGGHGGGGSHGGGSHGGWSGGGSRGGGHMSSSSRGAFHGGFHGSGFHDGGHFRSRFHFRPFFWGPIWGWDWGWGYPFYSSWWWWGGPWYGPAGYVAVAPGDGYGGEGYGYGYGRRGQFAIVKTDVKPEEAEVWLDGRYIGAADDFDGSPDFLYLKPGKYHLDFKTKGWEEYGADVEVKAGQFTKIDHKLKRLPGTDKLAEFPPSKGMPYGRVFGKEGPVAPQELRGRERSRARDDGGESYEQPERSERPERMERPERGERSDRPDRPGRSWDREPPPPRGDARMGDEPQPRSRRARLRFKVTPEDAAVYVDDHYVGAADDLSANSRGMVTDPGSHSVTITRPGYKTKTIDVTARAGAPVDVVVDLDK